ncbi:hypothetical protein Tco_0036804, partial [Tanacetum coccineum]
SFVKLFVKLLLDPFGSKASVINWSSSAIETSRNRVNDIGLDWI